MGQTIIHKNGKYNIYCSVMDKPVFREGVAADVLIEYYMQRAKKETEIRIAEAEATERGIEGPNFLHRDIKSVVLCNRAGENEEHLSFTKFIKKFLT